jgi:hypothetical protein
MNDIRKPPRLDFAASPWLHGHSSERTYSARKSENAIDLSPRLELGLCAIGEAEDEIPELTEN